MSPSPDASWTLEPGVIALVLVAGALYVRRWRAVRARDGARGAGGWRLVAFMAGLLAIVAALISPIDHLADQILAMHMVQHVILLDIVPILLLLGLTKAILRPITRRLQPIENAAGPFGHPVVAVVLYIGAMWVWHIPALYDAAAAHASVHVLEHITFLSAGLLYWWHLIGPLRSRLRASGMQPVAYMLSTKFFVGMLGIVLTFAPDALYAFYSDQPDYWGLTPGDDQAVAGLIMALEQSIIMGIALAWLFARMLTESEREEQRTERYGLREPGVRAAPGPAARRSAPDPFAAEADTPEAPVPVTPQPVPVAEAAPPEAAPAEAAPENGAPDGTPDGTPDDAPATPPRSPTRRRGRQAPKRIRRV
jgi:cytochrome c oxidase assembly factor CtaG